MTHFADNIDKYIFLNEDCHILVKISAKFVCGESLVN